MTLLLSVLIFSLQTFANVRFADTKNPVLRAIYPELNFSSLVMKEEPFGAHPHVEPRMDNTDCTRGFQIAEDVSKEWKFGDKTFLISLFFTTTTNLKGGCYFPRPWVCVLSKENQQLKPVACAAVEQEISFPDNPVIDTASYMLSSTEKAFGVRLSHLGGNASEITTPHALVLFRLENQKLEKILTAEIGHDEVLYEMEKLPKECSSKYIINVLKTRTKGFFDWQILLDKKKNPGPCKLENNPEGIYRWNGKIYEKKV